MTSGIPSLIRVSVRDLAAATNVYGGLLGVHPYMEQPGRELRTVTGICRLVLAPADRTVGNPRAARLGRGRAAGG